MAPENMTLYDQNSMTTNLNKIIKKKKEWATQSYAFNKTKKLTNDCVACN